MEYINKKTVEIYQADEVNLSNLCDGDLDFIFKSEFRELISKLEIGAKGSINIAVKVNKLLDASGDAVIAVDVLLASKYPKISISDDNKKRIAEDGKVLQLRETSMFDTDKG